MKYYLLHGVDSSRKEFMIEQFRKFDIPEEDVTWITSPNKYDPLPYNITTNPRLTNGQIACTYKHYLALKDIVENKHSIAVIMEDNIEFHSSVKKRIEHYLIDLPDTWDCLFDSDICGLHYIEGKVNPFQSVYLKSNEITTQCHGGSRGANFIMIKYEAAKKMYEKFLPFHMVSDHYYNYLLKTLNLNSYWSEPPNVHKLMRPSTCT
jgi:GR25 family glycosyltransferase involved in LPS biosynthesis